MNSLFKTVTATKHGPNRRAANDPGLDLDKADRIFIKDMVFDAQIGVYEEEKGKTQKLKISAEVWVITRSADYEGDDIDDVMTYEDIVRAIQQVTGDGHIHLLEHFAEKVAMLCLENPKAVQIKISLNKKDMFGFGEEAGIVITRSKFNR